MPEPSRLVLLDQLQTTTPGTKIRFLGCVHAYDGRFAQVILRCDYPATTPEVPTAIVNIESVLENLNHELLEIGSWLNVIGYVEGSSESTRSIVANPAKRKTEVEVRVAATMIWSAGSIRVDRYKSEAQEYQEPLVPG